VIFYWVIVFFGFTDAGLVVLPIWIGWSQYVTNEGSASLHGARRSLMGGALLGLAVTKPLAGARRSSFTRRERECSTGRNYERARALVATRFPDGEHLFARLALRFPAEAGLLKQWHAIAKSDTASDAYHRAVGGILALTNGDEALRGYQRNVFNEYFANAKPAPRLESQVLSGIGLQFARAGEIAEAERAAEVLFKQAPGEPRLAVLWEALAHALDKSADEGSVAKAKRYRALIGARSRAARAPRPA
jgi:hypothetical protein